MLKRVSSAASNMCPNCLQSINHNGTQWISTDNVPINGIHAQVRLLFITTTINLFNILLVGIARTTVSSSLNKPFCRDVDTEFCR